MYQNPSIYNSHNLENKYLNKILKIVLLNNPSFEILEAGLLGQQGFENIGIAGQLLISILKLIPVFHWNFSISGIYPVDTSDYEHVGRIGVTLTLLIHRCFIKLKVYLLMKMQIWEI